MIEQRHLRITPRMSFQLFVAKLISDFRPPAQADTRLSPPWAAVDARQACAGPMPARRGGGRLTPCSIKILLATELWSESASFHGIRSKG